MMPASGYRRAALLDQHRRRAGRVERQEFGAAFPRPLLDEARRQAIFATAPAGRTAKTGQNGWWYKVSISGSCSEPRNPSTVHAHGGESVILDPACRSANSHPVHAADLSHCLNRARYAKSRASATCGGSTRGECSFDIIKAAILGVVEGLTEYIPGILDRASAADRAFLRLRRRGIRQDLCDSHPARRHPGAAVDLLHAALAAGCSDFSATRMRVVSSSAC